MVFFVSKPGLVLFFLLKDVDGKFPEILWNCESVGLTILNVSTSVLLGGVFFLAIQRS